MRSWASSFCNNCLSQKQGLPATREVDTNLHNYLSLHQWHIYYQTLHHTVPTKQGHQHQAITFSAQTAVEVQHLNKKRYNLCFSRLSIFSALPAPLTSYISLHCGFRLLSTWWEVKIWVPTRRTAYGSDFPSIKPLMTVSLAVRSSASSRWMRTTPWYVHEGKQRQLKCYPTSIRVFQSNLLEFECVCLQLKQIQSVWVHVFLQAIHYWDSYPWERGAELRNVQVGHQGNSETVGEHQVGGYCIHYHSVRHGTANECEDDVGGTHGSDT